MAARVGRGSSEEELSSAPNSDLEGPFAAPIPLHRPPTSILNIQRPLKGSLLNSAPSEVSNGQFPLTHASSLATSANARQDSPSGKVRQPRKKKDPSLGTGTDGEKKERKPRKPREPRAPGTTAASRKKAKLDNADNAVADKSKSALNASPLSNLSSPSLNPPIHVVAKPIQHEAAKFTQNGLSMPNSPMRVGNPTQPTSTLASTFQPPPPPLRPSGASQPPPTPPRQTPMFDPIRSTFQETTDSTPKPANPQNNYSTVRGLQQTSTTPTISNIIESNSKPKSPAPPQPPPVPNPTASLAMDAPATGSGADASIKMDVDSPAPESGVLKKSSISKKSVLDAPVRSGSPKPARAKEQPPPVPPGSGLLSSTLFGVDSSLESAQSSNDKAPNIVLHIDLKDPNNKVINFARMAEEKYGFAALYPRQAAQRERLARVAAAGAALERSASGSKFGGTSAGDSGDDDVSEDIDRDSDNDGDVTMSGIPGGIEATNSGTDGPGPKKRRRRKMEEYDQDDPFVDDSEMLWEAQAAASKDGFFVYCGPLVPDGEKPAVERADGTIKRGRGRGRGGGPGSRGGRGGAASMVSEGGSGRGGGPGSRGGTTTRRPRMRKADRLLHEQQKAEKEKDKEKEKAIMQTVKSTIQAV